MQHFVIDPEGRDLVKRVFARHMKEIEGIVKKSEKDSCNPFLFKKEVALLTCSMNSIMLEPTSTNWLSVSATFIILLRSYKVDYAHAFQNRLQFCVIAMSYLEEFNIDR